LKKFKNLNFLSYLQSVAYKEGRTAPGGTLKAAFFDAVIAQWWP